MSKIVAICFVLLILITNTAAQDNPLIQAHNYWEKKDYCNALEKYEAVMKLQKLANYPYYYAAQSACQCSKPEAALDYAVKAFAVYQDFHNYEFFANDKLNSCFSNTPEWKKILGEMKPKYDEFNAKMTAYQKAVKDKSLRLNFDENEGKSLAGKLQKLSPEKLIKFIKAYKDYQNPPKLDHWTLYQIKNAAGEEIPFLIYIPKNYRPAEPKSLVVFLHGGVSQRPRFSSEGWIPYFEKGSLEDLQKNDSFIIYPFGKKGFNWLDSADCFETLAKQIRVAKTIYNIDDNRVFIGGHSDGATGSFWFAVNNRTDFAAFYGFAQLPRVFLGKLFAANLSNEQKLFSLNGEKDSLYKFELISGVHTQAKAVNANWKLEMLKGGDHNFMDDFPKEVADFYAGLLQEKRNPLPKNLIWQTDSENAKANFWLKVTKLNGSENAKINAKYSANVFEIESSGAKELQILIPDGLIDYKKEVCVSVNRKEVFKGKIKLDKNTIIENFIANRDRKFLITNKINVIIEK